MPSRGIPFPVTHELVIKSYDHVVYFKVFDFVC
jgi:hypothetical protein